MSSRLIKHWIFGDTIEIPRMRKIYNLFDLFSCDYYKSSIYIYYTITYFLQCDQRKARLGFLVTIPIGEPIHKLMQT